jgi:hypothetical protein
MRHMLPCGLTVASFHVRECNARLQYVVARRGFHVPGKTTVNNFLEEFRDDEMIERPSQHQPRKALKFFSVSNVSLRGSLTDWGSA